MESCVYTQVDMQVGGEVEFGNEHPVFYRSTMVMFGL